MKTTSRVALGLIFCTLLASARSAEPVLATASGLVGKATANVLIVRPRGADGRFGHTVTVKVRGTSGVTVVSIETRGGKPTLVQRTMAVHQLQPNQPVAVIYAALGDENVLLSAVTHATDR